MEEVSTKKKMSLPIKILIFMVAGCVLGLVLGPSMDNSAVSGLFKVLDFAGNVFMRLLRMCIVPLIFFSIISGVSQVADITRLKKVGITFLIFWFVSSALCACVGIFWASVMKPGTGIKMASSEAEIDAILHGAAASTDIVGSFVGWIPSNPFNSLAEGNVIQVIVFGLIFGVVLAGAKATEAGQWVSRGVDSINEIISRVVGWVITLSPYGVFALMATMTGTTGVTVLGGIAQLLGTMYIAMATLVIIVYPLILALICKVNPIRHYRNIYPVMLMAFSTQSSSATLPVTMKCSRERLGVPKDMVSLIAPPAATINMNGAAAEHPIYVLFAAQMFGINLALDQVLILVLLGVVISAGAAGMPGSGVVMCSIMLTLMGLPLTMIPWLAGVYFLVDIVTTTLNVTGDTVGMVTVANQLGELDRDIFYGRKTAETMRIMS